jgi:hypothetical protein
MKRIWLCVALVFASFSSALAQNRELDAVIEEWQTKTGIVVTQAARKRIAEEINERAAFIVATPMTTGRVDRASPGRVASDSAAATTGSATAGGSAGTGAAGQSTSNTTVAASRFEEARRALVGFEVLAPRLRRFPNVRVSVQPTPPRDYIVEINGDRYEATEQGLYGIVPNAPVSVRVIREGKPPCAWQGAVREGTEQTIKCQL